MLIREDVEVHIYTTECSWCIIKIQAVLALIYIVLFNTILIKRKWQMAFRRKNHCHTRVNGRYRVKINTGFESNRTFSCKLLLWCDPGEGPTQVLDVHTGFPMTNAVSIQDFWFKMWVLYTDRKFTIYNFIFKNEWKLLWFSDPFSVRGMIA